MPELPEVEVVKQSLQKYILNKNFLKIIIKNKKLRFPVPKNLSKNLSSLKITSIKRISKYVVIEFKHNLFLVIHLGMSGTLHLVKNRNNSEISYLCSNIFPVIVGTILIWKGVLDIAEAYIPKKIHYDIL